MSLNASKKGKLCSVLYHLAAMGNVGRRCRFALPLIVACLAGRAQADIITTLDATMSASEPFCYPGPFGACLSVAIAANTVGDEASVVLDVTAPPGITVEEIVIRDLTGRGLLNGSSLYAFVGAFTGTFTLLADFNLPELPSELALLQAQLGRLEHQVGALEDMALGLERAIDLEEERALRLAAELDGLRSKLAWCASNPDTPCVLILAQIHALIQRMQDSANQSSSLLEHVEEVRRQAQGVRNEIRSIQEAIDALPPDPDPRYAVLKSDDLSVDSWSGTRAVATPEPSSLLLMATAAAWLASRRRRHASGSGRAQFDEE
jgi:hypothetical protein